MYLIYRMSLIKENNTENNFYLEGIIMNKKTSVIVLGIFIAASILLGLLLINKGDEPVAGMILSDKVLDNIDVYHNAEQLHGEGIYLVVSKAFNKFQEDYKARIPEGKDLYTTIYFIECPKGSEFIIKWLKDGKVIKDEIGILSTDTTGVISYMLDGSYVVKGIYSIELYDGDKRIFEKEFTVE